MNEYNEFVADLIDRGKTNTQILRAILRLEATQKLSVPIRVFAQCDQLRILWQSMSQKERRQSQYQLNQFPPYGFFENKPWVGGMRMIFRSSGLDLTPDKLPPWLTPVLEQSENVRDCFSGRCDHYLNRIGILDITGRWSERNFQKVVAFIENAEAIGMKPDFYQLENYMNGLVGPNGKDKYPLEITSLKRF